MPYMTYDMSLPNEYEIDQDDCPTEINSLESKENMNFIMTKIATEKDYWKYMDVTAPTSSPKLISLM